jgi:hypothetical protein
MSKTTSCRDPLFLFVCYLEWHSKRHLAAYQELMAALDDPDCQIHTLAEDLLGRDSPYREPTDTTIEVW